MTHEKVFQDTIEWYNKNAEKYFENTKSHPRNVPLFISLLSGKKILDAGSGPGHDTKMFSDMGYDVTGIDISTKLLDVARKKFPHCSFVEGDLLSLRFDDQTFDGIWSQASLLHLETVDEVKNALNEFHRVLKPHGILYVRVKEQQRGQAKTIVVNDTGEHRRFFRFFTKEELGKLFINSGFSIIESEIQDSTHGISEGSIIMIIGKKN